MIEKLRRESIRLSQVQDIAGCRLVASDVAEQSRTVDELAKVFTLTTIVDRRQQPSHGYRAVHVIVNSGEKLIEIQVRTILQHLWAELSEKLSDLLDPAIKYGGGPERARSLLVKASNLVSEHERIEEDLFALQKEPLPESDWPENLRNRVEATRQRVMQLRQRLVDRLRDMIELFQKG